MPRILVLGANGMLGGSVFRYFSERKQYEVLGTVRTDKTGLHIKHLGFDNLITNLDVLNEDRLFSSIENFMPDFVVNCVGVIKQREQAQDPVLTVELNSLLPHRIASICSSLGAQLIHFSTDCVFSGKSGNYQETSVPDATDLYGRSKLVGEVSYGGHLTFRTSIIGHEMNSSVSLIDWFLSQNETVRGYSEAVFSGLPTISVAKFLEQYVFLAKKFSGLYHLSVAPIDKFSLLQNVSKIYGSNAMIENYSDVKINRSLDSSSLRTETGFESATWPEMLEQMHHEYQQYFKSSK